MYRNTDQFQSIVKLIKEDNTPFMINKPAALVGYQSIKIGITLIFNTVYHLEINRETSAFMCIRG